MASGGLGIPTTVTSAPMSGSTSPMTMAGTLLQTHAEELAVISGNNYIHHAAGMLESMLCISYEQYILDDEIIGQGCKMLEGINTDDDHLAYETIMGVGPGGHYLASDHTMRHMRNEYFMGNGVSDKDSRADGSEAGALSARERAVTMAGEILKQPLSPGIDAEIEKQIRKDYMIHLSI